MDTGFIDDFPALVRRVFAERGTGAASNLRVFNSLLADYAGGEFRKERKALIETLRAGRCRSVEDALAIVAAPPSLPASPKPNGGGDDDDDDDFDDDEMRPADSARFVNALLDKGFHYLKLEDPEEADRYFMQALDLDDDCSYAWFGHACAASQQHQLPKAVHYLEIALARFKAEGDRQMIKECNDAIRTLRRDILDEKKQDEKNLNNMIDLAAGFLDALLK